MNNLPVDSDQLLIAPYQLIEALPQDVGVSAHVQLARQHIHEMMAGNDNRLLVVVGPCSIHDVDAALEYAKLLKSAADHFINELYIVMRVYFEKPRTTVGWRGLISDPYLDGSFAINEGLFLARKLLLTLNQLGMPTATEFLNPIIPAYLSDLIAWSAVGARTVESQTHREMASGLAMPVGFKNNTDGNIKVAIDAVNVARYPHAFLGVTSQGIPAMIRTEGNAACHVILRGSNTASNYDARTIKETANLLRELQLFPRVMIDCSHGNSMKDYQRQQQVVFDITQQLYQGSRLIQGVMLESHLIAGKQSLSKKEALVYGQSITDGCMGWRDTLLLLEKLAEAKISRSLYQT